MVAMQDGAPERPRALTTRGPGPDPVCRAPSARQVTPDIPGVTGLLVVPTQNPRTIRTLQLCRLVSVKATAEARRVRLGTRTAG